MPHIDVTPTASGVATGTTVDHAICNVIRRQVPYAQHTVIEGVGHMLPLTRPGPLTRALLAAIER